MPFKGCVSRGWASIKLTSCCDTKGKLFWLTITFEVQHSHNTGCLILFTYLPRSVRLVRLDRMDRGSCGALDGYGLTPTRIELDECVSGVCYSTPSFGPGTVWY